MTITKVLAFDIETVPDVEFGRKVHGLEGLSDKPVGYVMLTRQREQSGSEFLSLEQHRVVAISVARRHRVHAHRDWEMGERLWETHLAGGTEAIRNDCETDVINTYLIYLRFELMRGRVGGIVNACAA